MDRDVIRKRIRTVLAGVLGHENFNMQDDMTATDVEGWDSLTHMTILANIEKEFSVRFKLREVNKLKDMGSLVDLILAKSE